MIDPCEGDAPVVPRCGSLDQAAVQNDTQTSVPWNKNILILKVHLQSPFVCVI